VIAFSKHDTMTSWRLLSPDWWPHCHSPCSKHPQRKKPKTCVPLQKLVMTRRCASGMCHHVIRITVAMLGCVDLVGTASSKPQRSIGIQQAKLTRQPC
jgi:hypothetical protein